MRHLTPPSLADLLAKDATALDPGRVVNISSVAGISTRAHGGELANPGDGLWSCECKASMSIRIPWSRDAPNPLLFPKKKKFWCG